MNNDNDNSENLDDDLFKIFIKDKIKLVSKYVAKNEINNKKYINILLFLFVNILTSFVVFDIILYQNTMRYKFIYYVEILITNIIIVEILFLEKIIFQFVSLQKNLPCEIISQSKKYKMLENCKKFFNILYFLSLSMLIIHDFDFDDNNNFKSIFRKVCIFGISLVIICYNIYQDKLEKQIEEKYINGDNEIVNKYIECFENLLKHTNLGLNIKGSLMLYINYLDTYGNNQNQNNECVICMENFENHHNIFKTVCNHIYHKDCIMKWIFQNINCPICRKKIM
jgi:hypothetical protein